MNELFKAILFQAMGYLFALILGVGILGLLMRGFLLKFINVKASLGRKVLVRVREVAIWRYYIGKFDEQDLIIGGKKDRKRINNIHKDHIYRSLGINWIDLDGKTWAILPPHSVEGVTGFDPEKQESLVTRALYKPPLEDMQTRYILFISLGALLAGAVAAYFSYNILNDVQVLQESVNSLKAGLVLPS